MRRVPAFQPLTPVSEMNTTPLIDVLLVLLVMFIITIPAQTHIVKLDLGSTTLPRFPVERHVNLVTIAADGTTSWNGAAISDADLRRELDASRQLDPSPELHLRPDAAARHGRVDQLLALIKREGITRFGFVGNERYEGIF